MATWEGKKKASPRSFRPGRFQVSGILERQVQKCEEPQGAGREVGVAIAGPAEPVAGAVAVPAQRLRQRLRHTTAYASTAVSE